LHRYANYDGDENSTSSIGKFLEAVNEFAEKHGALVVISHHMNASGKRVRGSTSLYAAMDASFKVSGTHKGGGLRSIEVACDKSKDDIERTVTVDCREVIIKSLPKDEHGRPRTSLVLEPKPPSLDDNEELVMWKTLAKHPEGLTHTDWFRLCEEEISRDKFRYRAETTLPRKGVVLRGGDGRYRIGSSVPSDADTEENDDDEDEDDDDVLSQRGHVVS
jgi:hypothetical protein